jgi:hypothetical protein
MKVTIVQNGQLSIVLQPETEIEKLQLKEVFKGPVEGKMEDTIQILGKNIVDSAVITPAVASQPKEVTNG